MSKRSLRLVLALTIGALLLAGCGDDGDDTSEEGEATDTTEQTDGGGAGGVELPADVELINEGQLTVCSDMPYEPFEYEEDGETKGFDFEVVSAMADELGLGVEFRTTPFDSIIGALAVPDCDMIASAMTITPERAEQIAFTEPYFDADQSLLVLKANEDELGSLEDLAGKEIGVQVETTGAAYAEENLPEGATLREFQTGDEMFGALVSNTIQAALQDFPVNAYRAAQEPEQFAVTETYPTGEQYGFAVTLENTSLLEALDAALAEIRSNGTYDEIFATWFGDEN